MRPINSNNLDLCNEKKNKRKIWVKFKAL